MTGRRKRLTAALVVNAAAYLVAATLIVLIVPDRFHRFLALACVLLLITGILDRRKG